MAEVLGIVGSVVGIAQLAGSIIITGTKLNGILKEMQEIPHEISTRLDQLHMLSLTLQQSGEADTIADVGPQFLLMGNAKQQCQTCLSGLTGLLEDITDRLQKSRGARRKLALARHMFRKDELARIEKQLSYSVDLLSVANQMYMIHLLESQRHNSTYLPRLLPAPHVQESTDQSSSLEVNEVVSRSWTTRQANGTSLSSYGAASFHRSFRQQSERQDLVSSWDFGLAWITGVFQLDIYETDPACDAEGSSSEDNLKDEGVDQPLFTKPKARVTISMPRWWSNRVIESLVYRSQVGWSQVLRTRNNLAYSYKVHCAVTENIERGDLTALVKQFNQRQLTPWDELQDGWNLFTEALKEGQWHICSYLLDHGVETYVDWQGYWPAYPHHGRRKYYIEDFVHPVKFDRGIEDQQLRSYQVLIRKVDHNDFLAASLLGCLQETPALFTSMRRSRWLDDEFYSPEFLEQRMRLCVHLVMKCADLRTKSADVLGMIPFCLEQHGNLAQALMDLSVSDNNGATLLHGLAAKFGVAGNFDLPQGQEIAERWTPLALEVIKRFPSLDCLCQTSARSRGPHLETPLLRLIQQSFDPRHPLCCQGPYRGSVCKRIKRCENSILSWLECLHVAGVNLREYGREEQRQHHVNSLLVRREFGLEYDCHSPGAHNWWGDVQLISFDFGESPSQWKFWWSEMTDEFAGQFWDMAAEQEISSLRIPGAWFEDDYPTSP